MTPTQRAQNTLAPKCAKKIYTGNAFNGHPCSKPATVEENGKHWCSMHAPSKRKARAEARHEANMRRWAEQRAKFDAEEAKAVEQKRRAECFSELLMALKECTERLAIHMKHTEDLVAHMMACKAIEKAEGT